MGVVLPRNHMLVIPGQRAALDPEPMNKTPVDEGDGQR